MNPEPRRRHLQILPDPEARFDSVRGIGDNAGDVIPQSLRADMSDAAELWESLHADGKQLRYEVDSVSGRVAVELCDLQGVRLRAIPLAEALGAPDDDRPAAG